MKEIFLFSFFFFWKKKEKKTIHFFESWIWFQSFWYSFFKLIYWFFWWIWEVFLKKKKDCWIEMKIHKEWVESHDKRRWISSIGWFSLSLFIHNAKSSSLLGWTSLGILLLFFCLLSAAETETFFTTFFFLLSIFGQ